MHIYWIIATAAVLIQGAVGAEPQTGAAKPQPLTDQALANQLLDTWEFTWPNREKNTRIELRADGNYEWWAPYLQSDLAVKTMIQSGRWLVRERTLSLRVEKNFLGHIPPGTALTYEIISVSSNNAVLNSPAEKSEVKWTKVSQQDEPFWQKAVSYEPPFKMYSSLSPTNAETAVGDWELSSSVTEAGTNAHAQVVFHLGTVAEFVGPDRPAKALATASDLKSFADSKVEANLRGGSPLTSILSIDGRKALMFITPTNQVPGRPTEWRCGVCFFWEINPVWQNSTICSITMTAETRETLSLLTNSLRTVKLLDRK